MRPGEVLDAQRDLLVRLDNDDFRSYVVGMVAQYAEGVTGKEVDDRWREAVARQERSASVLANQVRAAYAYRVTADMSVMVEHAANMLDDTDRFDRDEAPTGCGMVALERPLRIADIRGRTMLVHYLVWGPALVDVGHGQKESATMLWSFNDLWREPDELDAELAATYADQPDTLAEIRHMTGRWATVGVEALWPEQRLGPRLVEPGTDQAANVVADGETPHPATNMLRLIKALWMMMGQTVAHVSDDPVDRPARKRATRAGIPAGVTVIRLRREDTRDAEPGETHVDWSHRWITRGHWRWQPYGPEGDKEYRRIWIAPFVKGPADKPLVVTDKVMSLER